MLVALLLAPHVLKVSGSVADVVPGIAKVTIGATCSLWL